MGEVEKLHIAGGEISVVFSNSTLRPAITSIPQHIHYLQGNTLVTIVIYMATIPLTCPGSSDISSEPSASNLYNTLPLWPLGTSPESSHNNDMSECEGRAEIHTYIPVSVDSPEAGSVGVTRGVVFSDCCSLSAGEGTSSVAGLICTKLSGNIPLSPFLVPSHQP